MPGRASLNSFLMGAVLLAACLPPFASAEGPPPKPHELELLELYRKPNSYFLERLQGPREYIDGGVLHPKIQYYQEQRGRTHAAADATAKWREGFLGNPQERAKARLDIDRTWTYRAKITEPMKNVEDRMIPGPVGQLKIRIYTPQTERRGPLPVMVHYHGGAWIFGSIDASDRSNRLFANEADVIVVSVNYRLAPDYKFPAPQDDALAAFRWTLENAQSFGGDPTRVGVGGDSAGGQLAVVTALRQWEEGKVVPAYMMLYYPSVDMRTTSYSSYDRFGEGYGLSKNLSLWVRTLIFAKPEDREHRYASPMQAPSFEGMPPAIIATANFDIIRDQGRAIADRLKAEGVAVIYKNYSTLTHGFLQHTGTIDDALTAATETARWYGQAIRGHYQGKFY